MRFHWSIDKRPVIWQRPMWPTKSGRQWQDLCKNTFEPPGEKLNRLPDVRFLPVFFCILRYKLILDNTNITTEKLVWTIYHFVSVITWVLQLLSIAMSTNDQPLHIQVWPDPDWGSDPGTDFDNFIQVIWWGIRFGQFHQIIRSCLQSDMELLSSLFRNHFEN